MKTIEVSTRRKFCLSAGAAVSAPLALAAAGASRSGVEGTGLAERLERLERLEDDNAIRKLTLTYVRLLNAEAFDALAALYADAARPAREAGLRHVFAADFDTSASVELAPDRYAAAVRLPCRAALETPIDAPEFALADMARRQGEGVLRHTEDRVLEQRCVKRHDGWKIAESRFRS